MANKLKILNLSSCLALTRLPKVPESGSLEVLDLSLFNGDQSTWEDELDIGKLKNLKVLNISLCPKLETVVSWLPNMEKLGSLEITDMPGLREVEGLANLKSLQRLDLRGCTSLERLPPLEQLTELGMVNVEGCTNLADRSAIIGKLPAGAMIYQ
ncbi:unnamed protein product [Linum tenue]|uniref:R13L1/DRL21-like LRR repeat region domain-containing protein n=1 Tax=Linum tenue TaxID=586396 RepID=A0AAV0K9E7_9ROSI|nr:unnamed protein product [Linum tenue]